MLVLTVIMQWLHVFLGIFWFGASLYTMFIAFPALAGIAPEERQKVASLLGARTSQVIAPVALGVVLIGFLRGTFFGGLHSLDAVFGTAYGVTWFIALLLGIGLILWGALVVGSQVKALGLASASEAAEDVLRRLRMVGWIDLLGFVAIFTCMILMRFGY